MHVWKFFRIASMYTSGIFLYRNGYRSTSDTKKAFAEAVAYVLSRVGESGIML